MRILLSNDDGIHAPGIQTLAKALREFAEVRVVAPDRNRSGASNSLTLESSLRTFTFENGDIAVQMGTPTDCVYLGVNALMRPRPDIVVSGINAGPNLGRRRHLFRHRGRGDGRPSSGVPRAGRVAERLSALRYRRGGNLHHSARLKPRAAAYRADPNINVPDLPLDQIKGIRVTRCGNRHPADQ